LALRQLCLQLRQIFERHELSLGQKLHVGEWQGCGPAELEEGIVVQGIELCLVDPVQSADGLFGLPGLQRDRPGLDDAGIGQRCDRTLRGLAAALHLTERVEDRLDGWRRATAGVEELFTRLRAVNDQLAAFIDFRGKNSSRKSRNSTAADKS